MGDERAYVLHPDAQNNPVNRVGTAARTQALYDLDVAIVDTFAVGDGAWV